MLLAWLVICVLRIPRSMPVNAPLLIPVYFRISLPMRREPLDGKVLLVLSKLKLPETYPSCAGLFLLDTDSGPGWTINPFSNDRVALTFLAISASMA